MVADEGREGGGRTRPARSSFNAMTIKKSLKQKVQKTKRSRASNWNARHGEQVNPAWGLLFLSCCGSLLCGARSVWSQWCDQNSKPTIIVRRDETFDFSLVFYVVRICLKGSSPLLDNQLKHTSRVCMHVYTHVSVSVCVVDGREPTALNSFPCSLYSN